MPQTPSAPVNQLIEVALAVLNDASRASEFHSVVSQRLSGIQAVHQEFLDKAEALGPKFLAQQSQLIDEMEDFFERHQRTLGELLKSSHPQIHPDGLRDGIAELVQHTAPLMDCMQRYGQVFLGHGESRFPLLNLIKNVGEGLRSGAVTAPNAISAVAESRRPFEEALASLDKLEKRSAAVERKVQALDGLVAALEEAEEALKSKQLPRLKKIESALKYLEQAEEGLAQSMFLEGPTVSPPANVLLNCVRGGLKGIQPPSVVRESLNWYRGYKAKIEAQFDSVIGQQTESVLILEELPKTRAIMDRHDDALNQLEEALEELNPEVIEPILSALEQTIQELHQSSEVFITVAQREAEVLCSNCSRANPRVNRRCEACGAALPQIPQAATGGVTTSYEYKERLEGKDPDLEEGVVTENTYKLFEACHKFNEGLISAEQFLSVVHWSRERLKAAQYHFQLSQKEALATPEEVEQLSEGEKESYQDTSRIVEETKELMAEALEDWQEGLDLMEEFASSKARPTAELAARRIWDSSQQLVRIQKIGELADKQLQEMESQAAAAVAANPSPESPAP